MHTLVMMSELRITATTPTATSTPYNSSNVWELSCKPSIKLASPLPLVIISIELER
jgi:hypothetical protein